MTRLLVPILFVILALTLAPRDAQAPGAEIKQGIRLLGYEVRVAISVQPAAAMLPAPVPDSLAESETAVSEVAR